MQPGPRSRQGRPMGKKTKTATDAWLDRIFRGFWSNNRDTQRRQIREAMDVLDPDQKVWRRDTSPSITLH
jgi:hypothetical protein